MGSVYESMSWLSGGARQEIRQRLAVLGRADALLRHLGAGRVGVRADFEELCYRLGRPHDVHAFERVRKAVIRQRCDPAAEQSCERRPRARIILLRKGMAGDARPEYFGAV